MAIKQAERLDKVHHSQMRRIIGLCNQLKSRGEWVGDVTIGQPNFPTPQYIKDACVKALEEGHTGYEATDGIPEL